MIKISNKTIALDHLVNSSLLGSANGGEQNAHCTNTI